jgi:hypothetical protein
MKSGVIGLVLLFSAVAMSWAATTTLDAVNSGFYIQDGHHETGNYAVGWYGVPNNDDLRDYFIFDLSTVSGSIVSAFLRLSTAPPGFIVYGSNDPSETYTLFDVSTGLVALADGSGGVSAFNDLGSGVSYGSVIATSALGSTVDVPLNAAGIAFLATNHGQIAIGGAITTLAKGTTSEFLFNATDASMTRQLVITTTTGVHAIPTLNEWGIIIFIVLSGISCIFFLMNRRTKFHGPGRG